MACRRWTVVALSVALASCGDDGGGEGSSSPTSADSTASSTQETSAGPDASGPGDTTTASTSSTSPSTTQSDTTDTTDTAGVACSSAADCADGEFCDWSNESCGVAGNGVCAPAPSGCTDDDRPVCGCDDQLYGNACDAAAAGQDVAFLGTCSDPNGGFRCGFSYCISGQEYCLETGGIDPTFECVELPPVCQPPDCSCVATCCGCDNASCCNEFCTNEGGDLKYTCPGE